MDPKVILETALNLEEISAIEALVVFQQGGAIQEKLQEVSSTLNERFNQNKVGWTRGKKFNYTNVCRVECSFCSFRKKAGQKNAFTLSMDQIIRQVKSSTGARQITLEGGLNPELNINFHVELVRALKTEFPQMHLQAYSPSEVWFIAKRARTTPYDVLKRFRAAGLDSLPGDSADILNDKIRKKICPEKLRTNDWIDIVRNAHRMGMTTTASILFGHIENEIHICEHLEIIKTLQKETGGFTSFEPIPFLPQGTPLLKKKKVTTGPSREDIARMIAISRLFFGKTFPNIRVDWTKLGLPGTMDAIAAGANDLGTLAVDPHEIKTSATNGKLSVPIKTLRSSLSKAGKSLEEQDPRRLRVNAPARSPREDLVLV